MVKTIAGSLLAVLEVFSGLLKHIHDHETDRNVSDSFWGDELGRIRVWAANVRAHKRGQSSLDYRLWEAFEVKGQIILLLEDLRDFLQDVSGLLNNNSVPWDENGSLNSEEQSEFKEIHEEVVKRVDSLYQMSTLIRKPIAHYDRLMNSTSSNDQVFNHSYINHIQEKYPGIDNTLATRLGKALTRRKCYLQYLENHHDELASGLDGAVPELSETMATAFDGLKLDTEDSTSSSGHSQTSSSTSLRSSRHPIALLPPPGASASGKLFECPYCFHLITITSQRSWARHIFHDDIFPYIFVYLNCPIPDKLYGSRHEWFSHESDVHDAGAFPQACPLCKTPSTSTLHLKRHLARHLEELALFVLPRRRDDDDDVNGGYSIPENESKISSRNDQESSVMESESQATDNRGKNIQTCVDEISQQFNTPEVQKSEHKSSPILDQASTSLAISGDETSQQFKTQEIQKPKVEPTNYNSPTRIYNVSVEIDSTLGSDAESLTETITSENYQNHQLENRRSIYAFEEAAYLLPNDEQEQNRLDLQHKAFLITLGNKLHLAPLKEDIQSALDVATGTGIWAVEFADKFPSAKVIGTDLSPIQPRFVPPNCSFIVEDSDNREWSDAEGLTMTDLITYTIEHYIPDGKIGLATSEIASNAAKAVGVDAQRAAHFEQDLEEADFVDIHKKLFRWPWNPWSDDPAEKEIGRINMVNQDVASTTMAGFTRVLGWSKEKTEVYLVDVRKALSDTNLHTYFLLYVYWAKKPEDLASNDNR
ncbi:MAG: hypothetical protein M1834_007650 [Cirrosporium novae-zelandiae]|nr:MAG: hypothetical protein M1834_007650 [Cirrosporium novae-zelandiae]